MAKKKSKQSSTKKFFIFLLLILIAFSIGFVTYKIYTDASLSKEKTLVNTFIKDKTGLDLEELFSSNNESKNSPLQNEPHSTTTPEPEELTQNLQSSNSQQTLYIDNLEIPLCPKNALTITPNDTKGVLETEQKEDSHQIILHNGYTLCYREKYEQPEWVCYTLDSNKAQKNVERKDNFRPDPLVLTGSASLSDYKSSGYDRGHLAPSADLTYSFNTMDDSFYLSNMSPQAAKLNRDAWKDLEHEIRTLTNHFNILYIVTGPILEKDEYQTIGKNKVAVPEYYYKALLGIKNNQYYMIGFILPNKECNNSIWDYACSVDEVEKRTNLDFFSKLNDSIENSLEKSYDINQWKYN